MKKLLMAALMAASFGAFATEVYFSPNGGAEAALVKEINAAKFDLHVMTYQLTNKAISEAIIDAWKRGVTVKVIVDRSQRNAAKGDQYCCAAKVAQVMPVLLDAKHLIHHNKVVIIDKATVVTGSFNFSNAAEHANAENMLVLRDPELAGKYLATWEQHAAHSEVY